MSEKQVCCSPVTMIHPWKYDAQQISREIGGVGDKPLALLKNIPFYPISGGKIHFYNKFSFR